MRLSLGMARRWHSAGRAGRQHRRFSGDVTNNSLRLVGPLESVRFAHVPLARALREQKDQDEDYGG